MYTRGAQAYKTVDLESAPKTQVLDRLFLRLIDDIGKATVALGRRDIKSKAEAIDHASRIVAELCAALDHQAAPELCGNLASLYGFVQDRLATASGSLDVTPLAQAAEVIAHLRESFQVASAQP